MAFMPYSPPPAITQHVGGKEPISQKKLAQGDGNFETRKEMIGFKFDGVKRTVRLPVAKAMAYIKEAHKVLRRGLCLSSRSKCWWANSGTRR